MDRRSGDDLRHRIECLERMKATAPAALGVDSEIDRLRRAHDQHDRTFVGGRRASDPKPGWEQ